MTKKTLTSLIFGSTFAVVMTIYLSSTGVELGIFFIPIIFIVGMLLGRLVMFLIVRFTRKFVARIAVETNPGEIVVKEGGANHFKGVKGVGGKLVLTDKRLIFRSHELNIQSHQDSFELAHIRDVQVTKMLKILENGLMLKFKNETLERFVVDDPADWVSLIGHQKAHVG